MVKKIAGDFARATVIALHPESHDDTIFKAAVEKLKKEFNDVDISLEKEKTEETRALHCTAQAEHFDKTRMR